MDTDLGGLNVTSSCEPRAGSPSDPLVRSLRPAAACTCRDEAKGHSILGVQQPTATLAARIYERAHLTGEFRLRSGTVSSEYFDKYLFESDPELLCLIAHALVDLIPPGIDAIAGLELGGIPLATMVSQLSGIPALFVRKQAKPYGTRRLAEGGEIDGRRLAVIEDVITTAGQLIQSCRELQEQGAEIAAVLCVIDREAGGSENLAAEGHELKPVFSMQALQSASGS